MTLAPVAERLAVELSVFPDRGKTPWSSACEAGALPLRHRGGSNTQPSTCGANALTHCATSLLHILVLRQLHEHDHITATSETTFIHLCTSFLFSFCFTHMTRYIPIWKILRIWPNMSWQNPVGSIKRMHRLLCHVSHILQYGIDGKKIVNYFLNDRYDSWWWWLLNSLMRGWFAHRTTLSQDKAGHMEWFKYPKRLYSTRDKERKFNIQLCINLIKEQNNENGIKFKTLFKHQHVKTYLVETWLRIDRWGLKTQFWRCWLKKTVSAVSQEGRWRNHIFTQ